MSERPSILFLQMDNCGSENKNKYTLAFLSYLLYLGYFKEIHLSFLPAGHTHEDIDQMFSIFRKQLDHIDVWSCNQATSFLSSCYENLTHGEQSILNGFKFEVIDAMHIIYDWKTFFEPHMCTIEQHSKPHYFWFIRNVNTKKVGFHVRLWPTDTATSNEKFYILLNAPIFGYPAPIESMILDPIYAQDFNSKITTFLTPLQKQEYLQLFDKLSTPLLSVPFPIDDLLPIHPSLIETWYNNNVSITSYAPPALILNGISNCNPLSIAIGNIIAVYPEKSSKDELFWLGEVLSVTQRNVELHWYQKIPTKNKWKKMMTGHYCDIIAFDAILLSNIQLTKNGTLPNLLHQCILQAIVLHHNALKNQISNN